MMPTNAHELRPFWDAFRSRNPGCDLQLRHNPFINAFEPLRNGEIDVLIAWLPIEEPDFVVGPELFTESKVALVAPDHELADRGSISLETLGDFGVLPGEIGSAHPEYWEDAFMPFYTPSGRPILRSARNVSSLEDILTHSPVVTGS